MAEAKIEAAPKAKKTTVASKATGTVKAAVAKKAPAVKAAAPKVAAEKKTAAPRASSKPKAAKNKVTPEQRYRMICDAAYFKAESRGFSQEHEVQDWLDAEAEINRLLGM